ncbi:amino acid ABC transporter substrate-binding protein [Pseudomonas sp. MAFF212428]|uniref:Amino acid ABC transporter substrate-binding protein n=1 Tax=Pseudomonas brassicae TaxID=2708063 RepID=A0A6B3NSA4_9PSED|nr:transporter substrate-binding domain-containing protein [Pseudomonas brassicae]NER61242.1 amino acid ABC transporter substrate-binding protein [Pseudomonas brassicae]NER64796.1 amino acid ABC transporter substrate-binding protein [Pseudomonas brassicae]
MRPLLRAVGLLWMVLWAHAAQAEKLRLVADAWPPFTDASMPRGGLATAIVTTALQRAGYASEFEQVPWARALLGVGEGRYDVLINAWQNEARARIGQFSVGYLNNRVRLLRRKGDSLRFDSLADLHPHLIAVVRGYAYAVEFDGDTRLQKVPVRDFSVAVGMLAAGRVRLTVNDEYAAHYFLQRETATVREGVEFFGQPLSENSLHILVSLKNPRHAQIVAGFDQAIAAMKADGSYARLLKDYGL